MFRKQAFKPTTFDYLESREVMSTVHVSAHLALLERREARAAAKVERAEIRAGVLAARSAQMAAAKLAAKPAAVKPAAVGTPMVDASQDLNALYNAFESGGGNMTTLASQFPSMQFQGSSVLVSVKGKGNFTTFENELTASGMTITASSAAYALVIGYVPIGSLPTVAAAPLTLSVNPSYKAQLSASSAATQTTTVNTAAVVSTPAAFVSTPSSPVAKTAATGTPMVNASQDLNALYNAFQSAGGNVTAVSAQFPSFRFEGNSVSVVVKGQGNFNTLLAQLQTSGMTISTSSASYDLVVGYVPIASLPTIAAIPQTASLSPNYKPALN